MKKCDKCNSENADYANFCVVCNNPLNEEVKSNNTEEHIFNNQAVDNQSNQNINNQNNNYNPNNDFTYQNPINQNYNQVNPPVYQNNQMQQIPNQNYQQDYNQGYNQTYNQGYNVPQNRKSKAIGLILNIILVGLGYAYVGKWGEGIALLVVYLIMLFLSFFTLGLTLIVALALWIYSLFKTNEMIDKYNQGIPY